MPITRPSESKSLHQEVFSHYLRTGERLTNAEWLARHERKFNPYHDEIGRFTSPPGAIVSYGKRGGANEHRSSGGRRPLGVRDGAKRQANTRRGEPVSVDAPEGSNRTATPKPAPRSTNGAVDTAIREAWAPAAPISSYFDLNRRQAFLDALRKKAGSNASEADKAAFLETQRRLDAARLLLAEGDRIADRDIVKIARTALPPVDTGLSAVSILSGEGNFSDALTVASSIPIVGGVGKLAKLAMAARTAEEVADITRVIQLGGAYRDLRGLAGYEIHHAPGKAVSYLSEGDGPAIAMLKDDHRKLITSYRSRKGDAFRKLQSEHIARGDIASATQMDIDHIRSLFGPKYDDAIGQMVKYSYERGFIK